ncbi:MAG TPA: MbtH family NRPS accessory protein [Micromonospora sp.]|nr:MbtH family NRPS accessory protein [Micromonospora sp.]
MEEAEDQRRYRVVINDEDQYSIWPADSEPPSGWRLEGMEGDQNACLAHIDKVWTDMRPRSLQQWMAHQT